MTSAISSPGLRRRDLLKLGGSALMLSTIPAGAAAKTQPRSLWVFDSRLIAAERYVGDTNVIDVAAEHRSAWRQLRSCEPIDIAAGITRWSDFLIVRGHFESLGMRLQQAVERGPAFHWVFMTRSAQRNIS